MVSYKDALEIIKNEIQKLTLHQEEVDLLDSINRILAEDVTADTDMPPFNNSAMDGYAVKFSERKKWNIIGEISAGNYSLITLTKSDAVLITTGSKIPASADTVIPIEDLDVEGKTVSLKPAAKYKQGINIREKGSDLQSGQIAVNQFTKIDPKVTAALASCGKERVKVYQKLKAAILSTGDELIPVIQKPSEDKIRSSNNYSLYAAIVEAVHSPINLGFVKDDKSIVQQKIKDAFEMDIEILITSGGVSVGKYDFLKELFKELGVKEKFWRVNIKPGKPLYFGVYENKKKKILVFGLPGNPVSSLVNFNVFIKPAIDYLYHQTPINFLTAVLQEDLKKRDNKRHFSRGFIFKGSGEWSVTSKYSQSSGSLVEMSRANCLIVLEEEKLNPVKGERVKCILI